MPMSAMALALVVPLFKVDEYANTWENEVEIKGLSNDVLHRISWRGIGLEFGYPRIKHRLSIFVNIDIFYDPITW